MSHRLIGLLLGLSLAACSPPPGEGADVPTFDIPDVGADVPIDCTTGQACPEGQVCDPLGGVCVDCLEDEHCVFGVCHPEEQVCVQCVADDDCVTGFCHPKLALCVQCYTVEHCTIGVCDADNSQCVGCLEDGDCPGGFCNPDTLGCVGCGSHKDCDDGKPCTEDTCTEGECDYGNVDDGLFCEDGDDCTVDDACVAGKCAPGDLDPTCCEAIVCPSLTTPTDTDGDGCVDTCDPLTCKDNDPCPKGSYCQREPGECQSLGWCAKKPSGCDKKLEPVCGCDGKSHANPCMAAAAGISIAAYEACDASCGGGSPATCGESSFCDPEPGQCTQEFPKGTCVKKPVVCEDDQGPVCACNGDSFESDCERLQAGVAKDHDGPCGEPCDAVVCPPDGKAVDTDGDGCADLCACPGDGSLGLSDCGASCKGPSDCKDGTWCQKKEGACEAEGQCVPTPEACPVEPKPVCGCDGKSHENPCQAALLGVSIKQADVCK